MAPDASYVSARRWSTSEAPEFGKFLRVVPELVVEVLSPSTASRDRGEKKAIYERNGIAEYWIVDAAARRIMRFVLEAGRYGVPVVFEEDESFESRLLPGLTFGVAVILP